MKIYLDDNLVSKKLDVLLSKAGHTIARPEDVGLAGESDPRHLTHAILQTLVVLTGDWEDFEDLHHLILAAGGGHAGVVAVRFDNDPSRDMKPKQIVSALGKLERSGLPLNNELFTLNHWR